MISRAPFRCYRSPFAAPTSPLLHPQLRRSSTWTSILPRVLRPAPPSPTGAFAPPPRKFTPPKSAYLYAAGFFVYCVTTYVSYHLVILVRKPSRPFPTQDTDVSAVYKKIATKFDRDVQWTENVGGIISLRKKLVGQAKGDVLEVAVGTGRNGEFYHLGKGGGVRSLTFLDLQPEMIEVAQKKWKEAWPQYEEAVRWYACSALDAPRPRNGYTTVVQTMGICSCSDPVGMLRHLGSLVNEKEGRILLLEHGRGYYGWLNWVLDRGAGKHAERFGCWWNRDVGEVVRKSGLVVERMERRQFGTIWVVECRPAGWKGGKGREERGWWGGVWLLERWKEVTDGVREDYAVERKKNKQVTPGPRMSRSSGWLVRSSEMATELPPI